jgi:CelD/BcsL family acetyltransferase involved in cellulose biosynthesis
VAFAAGEAYAGRFYYGIPGYDPAYREYRVGMYVLMKMIEDLCEDESVTVIDFGPGDAEYKRSYGDRSWPEAEVHLFAPRLRPVSINVARAAILGANDGLASAAQTLGVVGRVKRWWRDRVTSRRAST